jgi:hypothetical protein
VAAVIKKEQRMINHYPHYVGLCIMWYVTDKEQAAILIFADS